MLNDKQYINGTYGRASFYQASDDGQSVFLTLTYDEAPFAAFIHFDRSGMADALRIIPDEIYNHYGRNKYSNYDSFCRAIANAFHSMTVYTGGKTTSIDVDVDTMLGTMDHNGSKAMGSINMFITVINNMLGRDASLWKDGDGEEGDAYRGGGSSGGSNLSSGRSGGGNISSGGNLSSGRSSGGSNLSSSGSGNLSSGGGYSSAPSRPSAPAHDAGARARYRKARNGGIVCLVLSVVLPILGVILLFALGGMAYLENPSAGGALEGTLLIAIIVFYVTAFAAIPLFIVGLVKTIKNGIRMRNC